MNLRKGGRRKIDQSLLMSSSTGFKRSEMSQPAGELVFGEKGKAGEEDRRSGTDTYFVKSRTARPAAAKLARRISEYLRERIKPSAPALSAEVTAA